jgi:hypothetical protein
MGSTRPALPAILLTGLVLILSATAATSDQKADSFVHPFSSRQEVEHFLRTAKIVKEQGTPEGITLPRRLTLDDGTVQNDAIFKTIDMRKRGVTRLETAVEYDFKDSWKFEIAAYELDKLLSLNMVPVTVERRYKEDRGSLQFWIEGFSESDRTKKGLKPPNPVKWMWQSHKLRIFDKLIFNIDRNLTNYLVTDDWQCVLIDHSRSFKSIGDVKDIEDLEYFSRSLMKSLEKLEYQQVKKACSEWLTEPEIRTTLQRRDVLLEYYGKLTKEKGQGISFP